MDCIAHGVTKSRAQLSDFHTSRKKKEKTRRLALSYSLGPSSCLDYIHCGEAETTLGKAQRTLISYPLPQVSKKKKKKPSPNSLFPFSTGYYSVDSE